MKKSAIPLSAALLGALLGILLGVALCLRLLAPCVWNDAPRIGDTVQHVYHRPRCAYLPGRSCRVYFSSENDAVYSEYAPCAVCCADD